MIRRTGAGMPADLADVMAAWIREEPDPGVAAVERLLRAPVSVAVRGRSGVGLRTVARALDVRVAPGETADIDVLVVAEALTEEDRTSVGGHTVCVVNKADLGGAAPGGPLSVAQAVAADMEALLRVPAEPMVALLADARIDTDDVAALRTLAELPADVSSVDAFVACEHPLPAAVRRDLIDRLDRFGLAHAILAASSGASAQDVATRLRTLSGVDAVRTAIGRAEAAVRYRRCVTAVRRVRGLAVERGDQRLAARLDGDDVVLALMTAAVEVVEVSGASVNRGDDIGAHSRRALRFHHLSRGPLDTLHRSCATDIARGSLRLLEGCGG